MFVFSFKASSIKIMCVLCACLIIGAAVIALMPEAGYAVNVNKLVVQDTLEKISVKSEKGRLEYIKALGFGVDEKSVSVKSSTVPDVFDAATEQYNALQKMQGFDLEKYKGKKVNSYTYEVSSFPDGTKTGSADFLVTLVIYKNKVVAADLCSMETGEVSAAVRQL